MNRVGLLALTIGATESLRPTLVPRTTKHQALVTAACAATVGLASTPVQRLGWPRGRWMVPGALGIAAMRARAHVAAQRVSHPDWGPRPQNTALAVATGTLAGAVLAHAPTAGYRASRHLGAAVAARRGGSAGLWAAGIAAGVGGALVAATGVGSRAVLARLREVGTAADAALQEPPDSRFVSGGPSSGVDYATLARDGRRFVWFRTPADQIRSVDGQAMEPIRVYVGLQSAASVQQRVELAMAELDQLGGFDRSNLFVMSPAGSGYADYVAAEAMECFTRGDCATVVVQYGVLPSMLSLGRVGLGAETVRALLDRVDVRVSAMASPPKVLMYGESLGARVAQEALQLAPARVSSTGSVAGLDALVCVGTPGGPSLRNELVARPGVVHLDRWQQITGDEAAKVWFVDHDADPVARWDGALAWRRPAWLGRPRGRNVPDGMGWLPLLTWWQVAFDLVFAAQQQSGVFHSVGHDYRADLAPILATVVGRGADVDKVAALLSQREIQRDTLLAEHTASSLPH